jgi:hypothetical protein
MSALAVGVTVALASLVCYLAMRGELRAQVDRRLRAQGELVERVGAPRGGALPAPPRRAGGPAEFSQVVGPVDNVLASAAAHSPPGGEVEVRVRDGLLEVRDHGRALRRTSSASSSITSSARTGAGSTARASAWPSCDSRRGPRRDRQRRQCARWRARRTCRILADAAPHR